MDRRSLNPGERLAAKPQTPWINEARSRSGLRRSRKRQGSTKSILLGGDGRFAGELFDRLASMFAGSDDRERLGEFA